MKILFCIDQYRPSRGGAERYLADLSAALCNRGHRVFIAALEAEEDGVSDLVILEAPRFPRMLREVVFAVKAARLKREGAYDRVVGFRHVLDVDRFQPHEGLFLDSLLGAIRPVSAAPFLRALVFVRKLFSPKNLFFLYADRKLFRSNPGLRTAALSEMTARSIRARHGACKPEISVIPNGAPQGDSDSRRRARDRIRAELGVSPRSRILLFAAHNFRLKGLREALEGFALYRERREGAVLVVAGRGRAAPYGGLVRQLKLEGHVAFLGARSDMSDLYAAADLLLHPTFYDPCSLVVLEALGAGLPAITTKYNGASELMPSGRGGMVLDDPRDGKAMADAIHAILDRGDYDAFAGEAARIGRENSFQQHVDRVEKWIAGE
jgi:UDP-glucose:(heptosyl)LPS alpha-1,3-glucosyltransferase